MLLNLFDQYTNLCSNITKIFYIYIYIYNFINYACMCILIDWFFEHAFFLEGILCKWGLTTWLNFFAVSKSWGSYVDNICKESSVTTNMGFVVKTYAASSKERITLWKVEKEGT